MKDEFERYRAGQRIYILVSADSLRGILDDWLDKDRQCDLLVKKSAKTPGRYVIETKELMWAVRVIRWHKYIKVTYR